jgi:cytochrome c peroxidase
LTLSGEAERGRQLFEGAAACNECHIANGTKPRFSDELYHHSGVGQAERSPRLSQLSQDVIDKNLNADELGPN